MFESAKVKKEIERRKIAQKADEIMAKAAAKKALQEAKREAMLTNLKEKQAENKRINDLRIEQYKNASKEERKNIKFSERPRSHKIVVLVAGFLVIGALVNIFEREPTSANKNLTVESVQAPIKAVSEKIAANTATIENKAVASQSNRDSSAKPSASLRDKIDDYIFTPYTKSQYSKTFSKFGSRMGDVEKARQAAAFLAAASGKCTFVDMSEVSDASTRNNIKIFTDCRGLDLKKSERFRFEESELKDAKGRFITEKSASSVADIQTIEQRAFPQDAALTICRETVRKSAKFPSSVDFAAFGQVVNTSQASGETWVELDFEAKNGIGAMLPFKANCGFPIHGKPTFSVSNR